MDFKGIIKFIVPKKLWFYIRKRFILVKHYFVALKLHTLIKQCNQGLIQDFLRHTQKVVLPNNSRIIWQYWAQGFDRELPEIIRLCLDSVVKYCPNYQIIRICDQNVNLYVDIPEHIMKLKEEGKISIAHFSDILRLALLSSYGGIWIDTTVLLTGSLPERLLENDFFVYQRDKNEKMKNYWENAYAYYFGWGKGFRVNMLSSIIYSKPHCKVINDLYNMLISFWEKHTKLPDYFLLQILFDLYIKENPQANCRIVNDCIPHYLIQMINDEKFNEVTFPEIMKATTIHKLTYKCGSESTNKLKSLLALI